MMKLLLQLKFRDPRFAGACVTICYPSNALTQLDNFYLFLIPLAIFSQFLDVFGGCKYPFSNTLSQIVSVVAFIILPVELGLIM